MNPSTLKLIREALKEDMPDGDVTTDNLEFNEPHGRAKLVAKEDLVLSGVEIFNAVVRELDPGVKITWHFKDGDFVFRSQTVASIQANLKNLLKAERVALNFIGRLSGIATLTKCFVDQTKATKTSILDTRKTTPGLRALEKQAVVHGGGVNHRMNLSDGILLKENHIRLAGGIKKSVLHLRKMSKLSIQVEVRNLKEVEEAVNVKVDRLLLDNMTDDQMAEALKIIPGSIKTEASGNMTLDRIERVAKIGVDFISVGAITHSAPCADISLLFD